MSSSDLDSSSPSVHLHSSDLVAAANPSPASPPLCPNPPQLMILTLYLQRLIFHHIPPNETIVSSFLPLGPTGLGGFSLLKLGAVATKLFPLLYPDSRGKSEVAGWALWGFGLGGAILLWSLGVWFMFVALGGFFLRWREGEMRFNVSAAFSTESLNNSVSNEAPSF